MEAETEKQRERERESVFGQFRRKEDIGTDVISREKWSMLYNVFEKTKCLKNLNNT